MPKRHYLVVAVFLVALGMESCTLIPPDSTIGVTPHIDGIAPSARLMNVGVDGPFVSIYAHYSSDAPANRVQAAFLSGVRIVGDATPYHALRFEVRKSSLRSVLTALKGFTWLTSIEVDSTQYRATAIGPIAEHAGLASRRSTQLIPSGILLSGSRIVDSALGVVGSGIKVAVIDAGIDCSNSDLSGAVSGGYDFIHGIATACDTTTKHGTAVAGIIAAADDGGGVVGMAPAAHLYSYVVIDALDHIESSTVVAEAIDSAIAAGVKVINFSFGDCGGTSPSNITDAIARAIADSIAVVAAAGNGSQGGCSESDPVSSLARLSGVIAVSEFDSTLVHTSYGQYGSAVALSGPGFAITDSLGSGYTLYHGFGGTSSATPHVAGAFALALAAGFTRGSAINRLESVTRLAPGQTGRDNYNGYGQVDAAALIAAPIYDSLTWCTNGNVTADSQLTSGSCPFIAHTRYGAPPVQAKFVVITSVLHDTTTYDWGPTTRNIYIPPTIGGNPADSLGYTMSVYTYVQDSPFHRAASPQFVSFYVCNIGSEFIRMSPPPPISAGRGVIPDLPAGCQPP